jgi:hypothetical protein
MTTTKTDIWSSLLDSAKELHELKRELHGGYSASDEQEWESTFAVAETAVSLLRESPRFEGLEDRARSMLGHESAVPQATPDVDVRKNFDAYTVKLREDDPSLVTNIVVDAKGDIVARGQSQADEWEHSEEARAEQERLVRFANQANRAEAAQQLMSELLSRFETFGQLSDQYGSETMNELMQLQDAILNGGYVDYYDSSSRLLEVIGELPSADRWSLNVSVIDALIDAEHDPKMPEEIWLNYRRVFSGEEGSAVAIYNDIIGNNGKSENERATYLTSTAANWRVRPFEPGDLFELRSHGVKVAETKFSLDDLRYLTVADVRAAVKLGATATQDSLQSSGPGPDDTFH